MSFPTSLLSKLCFNYSRYYLPSLLLTINRAPPPQEKKMWSIMEKKLSPAWITAKYFVFNVLFFLLMTCWSKEGLGIPSGLVPCPATGGDRSGGSQSSRVYWSLSVS